MKTFVEYYLTEMQDSRRNRESVSRSYGVSDTQASELIKQWTAYSPYIDKDEDYGFPRNIPKLDPRDIYAWSKVSKQMGWDHPESIQNLEAMLTNLKRVKHAKDTRKEQDRDYSVVYQNDHVTVYQPKSEGASCRLGSGTKWCTAATKGVNHFDSYIKRGVKLFYIIAKPGRSIDGNAVRKFAIAEHSNGRREYFDEWDEPLDDEEFKDLALDPYQIDTTGWLKEYNVIETLQMACANLSKMADETDSYNSLMQAQEDIIHIIMHEISDSEMSDYHEFRKNTGMPDRVFLETIEKNGLSPVAASFFLSSRMNDPGEIFPGAEEHNRLFRGLIEDAINDRTDLALRGGDRILGNDAGDWEQLNQSLGMFRQQERVYDFINYSKNWTGGNWTGLHQVTLDALQELGPRAFVESNEGMMHAGLLRICLNEMPEKRFIEFENVAIANMQEWARDMVGDHPGDLALGNPGENEEMEQWTIKMRKLGWVDLGMRYNTFVAGAKGTNDKVNYIPNNPSSYERLFEYPLE